MIGEAMTVKLFLSLFRPFDNGIRIDGSDARLAAVVARLPEQPREYVRLAEEAVESLLLQPEAPEEIEFQRFEDALRYLLGVDGRTAGALLRIAELAYEHPRVNFAGINALAGLAGYLRSGQSVPGDAAELVAVFERLMGDAELFHNARECRNALWKRRSSI
jgi:hypothetical protein